MEPYGPSDDGSYQQWLRIHRMYSTGSASLQAEAKSFVAGSWFCMWSFLYGLIFLMPFIFAYHNISVGLTCEGIGQEFYWWAFFTSCAGVVQFGLQTLQALMTWFGCGFVVEETSKSSSGKTQRVTHDLDGCTSSRGASKSNGQQDIESGSASRSGSCEGCYGTSSQHVNNSHESTRKRATGTKEESESTGEGEERENGTASLGAAGSDATEHLPNGNARPAAWTGRKATPPGPPPKPDGRPRTATASASAPTLSAATGSRGTRASSNTSESGSLLQTLQDSKRKDEGSPDSKSDSGSVYQQAAALYRTTKMVPSCILNALQWASFIVRVVLDAALLAGIQFFLVRREATYGCADRTLVVTMDIIFWVNAVFVVLMTMALILGAGLGCAAVFLQLELKHADEEAQKQKIQKQKQKEEDKSNAKDKESMAPNGSSDGSGSSGAVQREGRGGQAGGSRTATA